MSDLQLLLDQLRLHPEDRTLLSAYSDALEEDGQPEQAQLAKELLQLETLRPVETDQSKLSRWRLRFLLRIRQLAIGDFLAIDRDHRVFPVDDGAYSAGVVIDVGDGTVHANLYYMGQVGLYQLETIRTGRILSQPPTKRFH